MTFPFTCDAALGWSCLNAPFKGLILHGNGTTWKRVATPGGFLFGVAAVSASNAWVVGGTGRGKTLILHWNGTSWK